MYSIKRICKKDPYGCIDTNKQSMWTYSASLFQTLKYIEYLNLRVDPVRGEKSTYIIDKMTSEEYCYDILTVNGYKTYLDMNKFTKSILYNMLDENEEFWECLD